MENSFKRLLSLVMVVMMVVSMMPTTVFAAETDNAVAKVGNTEYATIDEAIANWTNGTTLTLLADVTLSDVIKLSSTEYHILDLGTYTMTAAKNKDAIQYVVNGRASASYALDIKADATNPGGITATGGSVVRHTKPLTGAPSKDRPITRFYGGVFNASYVVRQGGTFGAGYTGASAPYFQFYGGEFNGTIYTNRSQNQFHGGTFNGSMQMSVDSSAYTLIAGGTFKNLSNLMDSALNSDKFTIGSAKGKFDKEVYIDDNGNYVIAAAEPAQGIEAAVAKTPGTNDYLAYSKVATEGALNYTDVYMALEKNKTAAVTVYAEELDLAGASFTGTIVVPEGQTLTITNAPEGLKTEGDVKIVKPGESVADLTISNAEDLIAFAKDVNENKNEYSDKLVVLADDIDLAGSEENLWTPIGASGDSAPKFRGTFDGQGHTIKNLYVKQGAAYHAAGLFGAVNGTIQNLTIDGAYVESLSSGSATVNGTAVVAGSTAYGATIDNVHVMNATVKGNRYVAGIVGYMDGTVTGCSVENLTLIATPDDLTGSYDNGDKVGGIVGYCNSNAVEISGCELKGEVNITAYRDVAGLVGCASTGVKINNNTNNAAVVITIDQVTNSYGEKTPNAAEFIGRNTPAEATGNTTAEGASCTINTATAISGTITDCQIDMTDPAETFIASEIMNLNATKSVEIKLYSGGTHIATTTLQKSEYFQMNTLGVKIIITGESSTWYTKWEEGKLSPEYVPDKVVLFVDDKEMSSAKVPMIKTNGEQKVEWADVPGVAAVGLKGEGTEKNPFLIENLKDLIWFRDKVDEQAADGSTQFAGKYFKLTADIDLAGINWNPIGSKTGDHASFKGVFDGGGHTISNLNCQQAGEGLGLFAYTSGNAEIKNLTLDNVTVKSTDNRNYVAAVVGNAFANTKITNVHVTGAIDISGRGYIGGIAGHGYVVMDNVSVVGEGTISSTFWCAGGILGYGGEGATNITNAKVEGTGETGLVIKSAAGGLGSIVGMAEDNNGTQPISGSNLSAKNVKLQTYDGDYSVETYGEYALGYLYGGSSISILTGTLSVENVTFDCSTGNTAPEVVDAVATVGSAVYFSLQAAVDAAEDGETVKLLRNATGAGFVFQNGDDVVIDLNSHTYTLNESVGSSAQFGTVGFYLWAGSKVTIQNGTIDMVPDEMGDNVTFFKMFHTYGDLTLTDVTLDCANGVWQNGTNDVGFIAVESDNGTLNINGSTSILNAELSDETWTVVAYNKGKATVDTTGTIEGVVASYGTNASMEIKNGTFTENNQAYAQLTQISNGKFTVSGGSFTEKVPENFCAEGFIPVDNGNGTYGVKVGKYVAQIGDKKYESLDAALDAAKAANMTEVEVILLADCKFSTKVGNFKKVTFTGTNREQIIDLNLNAAFDKNVELVFNDLTVSRLDTNWLYHYFYVRGGLTYNDCKMIGLFNVTAQDTDFIGCDFYNDNSFGDGNYSLWVYNSFDGVEVNVTDCTYDVYERAIKMYGDGYTGSMVLNISGTKFTSRTADKTVVEIAQDQNCSAGKFTLNVNNSTYTGFGEYEHAGNDNEKTLFNVEVSNGATGGDVKVFKDNVQLWPLNYVAEVNGVKYESLQAAINAAGEGDTVTLLTDIELTKEVIIDADTNVVIEGEGKTISGNCDIFAVQGGTLTLGAGLNVVSNEDCAIFVNKLGGTVNTAANLTGKGIYDTIYVNGAATANVTITDGTIVSEQTNAVYFPCQGKLTIIGGTLTGQTAVYFKSGSLEITGGTFNGVGAAEAYKHEGSGATATGDALVIENVGGTSGYEAIESVSITDGTFNSTNAKAVASYTAGNEGVETVTGFITGGTYSSDVNDLCAPGYKAVSENNETWTVQVNKGIVAWNVQTGAEYETVSAALLAAKNGETVQLLVDSEELEIYVRRGRTLDLNGHTLTVEDAAAPFADSHIIDSTEGEGLLKIAQANIALNGTNKYLPVWVEGGCRFTAVSFGQQATDEGNGTAYFQFYLKGSNDCLLAEELKDGGADNKLSVQVKMTWTNASGTTGSQYFVFTETLVKEYAANYAGNEFRFTVTGTDAVSDLKLTAVVVSGVNEENVAENSEAVVEIAGETKAPV